MKLTYEQLTQYDELLRRGIYSNIESRNGKMSLETVLSTILDLKPGDRPHGLSPAVRKFITQLSNADWSSPEARAHGLYDLGLAQLGSLGAVNDIKFARHLAEQTVRQLLPTLFRNLFSQTDHCLAAATRCAAEGTKEAADVAEEAARKAVNVAAHTHMETIIAAATAAETAGEATVAAESAMQYAGAESAAVSASVYAALMSAATAGWAVRAAGARTGAAEAVIAAGAAAEDAGVAAVWAQIAGMTDQYLILAAKIALCILQEMNAPGCQYLTPRK